MSQRPGDVVLKLLKGQFGQENVDAMRRDLRSLWAGSDETDKEVMAGQLVPIAGDAAGLANDYRHWKADNNGEHWTAKDYALTGLGLLPLVPAGYYLRKAMKAKPPGPQKTIYGFAKPPAPEGPGGMEMGMPMIAGEAKALTPELKATDNIENVTSAQPQGILAEHSSPALFDKFDVSKSGTGYGTTRRYGPGLYFTEKRSSSSSSPHNPYGSNKYEVRINAKPDELLDTSKPLDQQSPQIFAALDALGYKDVRKLPLKKNPDYEAQLQKYNDLIADGERYPGEYGFAKPQEYLAPEFSLTKDGKRIVLSSESARDRSTELLRKLLEGQYRTSNGAHDVSGIRAAAKAGIKGHTGSGNLVIWDDNIIDILKRNGMSPSDLSPDKLQILKKYGIAAGAIGLNKYMNNRAQQNPQKPLYGMSS